MLVPGVIAALLCASVLTALGVHTSQLRRAATQRTVRDRALVRDCLANADSLIGRASAAVRYPAYVDLVEAPAA